MRLVPIASDGWRFILPAAAVGAVLVWLGAVWSIVLGAVALLFATFSLFFFRDFDRTPPADAAAIVSPGDGKVVDVSPVTTGEFLGEGIWCGFFLSVFDGHVQRSPVAGRVETVHSLKENFLMRAICAPMWKTSKAR